MLAQREPEPSTDYCVTPVISQEKSDDDFIAAPAIDNSKKPEQSDHSNIASASPVPEHPGEASDNFALGALFYVMSMGFSAGQSIFGKVMYTA